MTDRTDGDDQGSSSDDLIRRARENYEPTDYASPAPIEPATPTGGPAPYEPPAQPDPSDYVRSEYRDQPAAAGSLPQQPTYQAQQPSFFSRYGRLLIFGVIIAGFIAFSVLDKTKNIDDLEVGDCLQSLGTETISNVESADCTSEHQFEVFAIVTSSASDSTPYPGDEAIAREFVDLCLPRFEPYVGTSYEDSIWFVDAILPAPESWDEANYRSGSCLLYQPGTGTEPLTLTVSARGSNQ